MIKLKVPRIRFELITLPLKAEYSNTIELTRNKNKDTHSALVNTLLFRALLSFMSTRLGVLQLFNLK